MLVSSTPNVSLRLMGGVGDSTLASVHVACVYSPHGYVVGGARMRYPSVVESLS